MANELNELFNQLGPEKAQELSQKAATAEDVAEIVSLAQGEGIQLTQQQAQDIFEKINEDVALDDADTCQVAGAGCCSDCDQYECFTFGHPK